MATKLWKVAGDDFLIVPGSPAGVRDVEYTLYRVDYNNRSAGTRYLHVFFGTAVPANSTVPDLPPITVAANSTGSLEYKTGLVCTGPGLVFAVSSTKDTLTSVGAATDDIYVELEADIPVEPAGTSVAGDYTTQVTNLAVWTDANGPKTLYRLEITETDGNAVYIQLFPSDSPAEGAVPLEVWPLPANGELDLDFGVGGKVPWRQTAAYVAQDGCTIVASTTQNTKTVIASPGVTIRATYK